MEKVSFYRWSDMPDRARDSLLKRSQSVIESVIDDVRPIIEDVRLNGNDALIRYAKRFDQAALSAVKVPEEDFAHAARVIGSDLKTAIDRCIRNVRAFHVEQMRRVETEWMVEIEPGVYAGEKVTPVESVGLYVPHGKNAFPSALYMLAVPAVIAGVGKIAVTTPPRKDGRADPVTLYAAQAAGVSDVYLCGGAQAIAALAYGTQTVPRCAKVLGPGSAYVAAAKLLLSSIIDPGMPAGPSESLTLCDETADPDNTVLDLLNEAEHGPDSAALLVTHDEKLARHVHAALPAAISALPDKQATWLRENFASFGGIILTDSLAQSIAVANAYAPEHLLLKVAHPDDVLPLLNNAGEILIGEYSAYTLGNYGTGVNHVLPTGGFARSFSCTSVWDFLKRTSLSRVTREGFASLSPDAAALARYEGFPAHENALTLRKL